MKMALTLAKFLVSNQCNKGHSLRFLNHAFSKKTKCSSFTWALRGQSTSIAPQIDKFIPLSSRTLFKRIMEDKGKKGEDEDFKNFAIEVESMISKQNYSVLPELKFFYSALDPDLPTPGDLSSHELADRHFWFMQHLSSLLSSAGFEELKGFKEKMRRGVVGHGVVVDCDVDKYDIFQVWVMGGQKDESTTAILSAFPDSLYNKVMMWKRPKRVVVLRRAKGERKVDLKLFKGVTSPSLLLPPSGSLKMHPTYKNILITSSTLSLFFLLSRPSLVWLLGTDYIGYAPVALAGGFGALSVVLWGGYKHMQKHHLQRVLDTMYDGVVRRNMECVNALLEKSQEELLKGVLLAHHFLTLHAQKSTDSQMTIEELERDVEEWMRGEMAGVVVRVSMDDTIKWMKAHSLVHHDPDTHTLSLIHSTPPGHHASHSTHLFHNTLSETTDPIPVSTTLMQNVRRAKGTA